MHPSNHRSLQKLQEELLRLRAAMLLEEKRAAALLRAVSPEHRKSAVNLVHYVAMRSNDIRRLQLRLAELGLSSLGRSEPHTLDSVSRLLGILERLSQPVDANKTVKLRKSVNGARGSGSGSSSGSGSGPESLTEGSDLLHRHTQALLGPTRKGHDVRVMVTMPSEAASDYDFVRDLLRAGMDCMRINCAHDEPKSWLAMIANLKRARRELGRDCKVLMDLPGPKIRTGPIESAPAVRKVKPKRDEFGRVRQPARVWLTMRKDNESSTSDSDITLVVDADWLSRLRPGKEVQLRDTRGRIRKLQVTSVNAQGAYAELTHTAYVTNGTLLKNPQGDSDSIAETKISGIEEKEGGISLNVGDTLVLTRSAREGKEACYSDSGQLVRPAHIACSPSHALESAKAGDRVSFDDGKLVGHVEKVRKGEVHVRISQTQPGGSRLKADKSINLPDGEFAESALTKQDLKDLEIVIKHADLVGLSFVNDAQDVRRLIKQLRRLSKRPPGIVIKIETQRGFEQLPSILLAAMRHPTYGVMVARGDLAVECGYERLAEIQEEILWLCEAAHCPAIWATQVLESLAKKGTPSRAEISDAALSHRAECVMLNKGPYILQAVTTLEHILKRMDAHQLKKRSLLRALTIAKQFRARPRHGT